MKKSYRTKPYAAVPHDSRELFVRGYYAGQPEKFVFRREGKKIILILPCACVLKFEIQTCYSGFLIHNIDTITIDIK